MRIDIEVKRSWEVYCFVKNNHYTKTLARGCKYVYTLKDITGTLIGVAMFGCPVGRKVKSKYDPNGNLLELKRLVLKDAPKNSASWFISRCIKILRSEGITSVISYADPSITYNGRPHDGTVYKACNFKYLGVQNYKNPLYYDIANKEIIHGRALYQKGVRGDYLRSLKSKGYIERINKPAKHIYLYQL